MSAADQNTAHEVSSWLADFHHRVDTSWTSLNRPDTTLNELLSELRSWHHQLMYGNLS